QQVDQHLFELNRVSQDQRIVVAQLEIEIDLTKPELFLHQRQRPHDDVVDQNRFPAYRRGAAKRAKVRDDFRRLSHLMHSVIQLAADSFGVRRSKLNQIKRVADEQPDVIERVVQLVRNASGQLAERGELSCLDELFLLVAEF